MTRITLILAALCLLAGCGGDEEPMAAAAPAQLAETITYEVIGGDAFRDDKVTVQADGSATVQTRKGEKTAKLTADEREALAQGVHKAGLTTLESALTDPPIPDALSYRFTYQGRQVETDSGKLPDQLGPMIGTFNDLIERYGPS
jgi:hypothetical protein